MSPYYPRGNAGNVRDLVKRLANIGELRKLRLLVGRSIVRRILMEVGLTPSPHRRGRAEETVWRKFIRVHVKTLVAADFFTKNVITPLGIRVAYCMVFIHVGTRKVYLSPATYNPHDAWVQQQARNVLMWLRDQPIRFVLHERDAKFSFGFDRIFHNAGVQRVRTPLLAPDANAFAESWIESFKRECLNHFLCFSLGHLEPIATGFVEFYNKLRPHQSLGNRRPPDAQLSPPTTSHLTFGRIRCRRPAAALLSRCGLIGKAGRDNAQRERHHSNSRSRARTNAAILLH